MDTGWRRNKYGGLFNINDIDKNKSQRYTVVHKTKIGEEVGENYGTLEEGIDYYKRFFDNPRSYELQDEKGNKIDVNKYMNEKIRNDINKIKTRKEKIKYINDTYKDILRFPIEAVKVKKFDTGDQKTGKYDWQYDATLKPKQGTTLSENISTNSLEEMYDRLKAKRG